MEWLIGLYLLIGASKTASKMLSSNPATKPMWMLTETNPVKRAIFFTLHALLWPLTGR